ncbi:unnamed protein product, partial [Effrenium voratum]
PSTSPLTAAAFQPSAALKVVNMTKTGYLIGMCPLFVGVPARVSCILPEPMLTRELPCVIRRIELRPKEPPVDSRSACVVLRDQPLGVLVEVDDRENSQLQLPAAAETPKGHFFVAPVIEVQRRAQAGQVPLAPREVLTHLGLPAVD